MWIQSMISFGVTGASLIVIGLMGGSFGSHHGETVQNVYSCNHDRIEVYLLFNYLSLCPQLSCMHCNINPTLLIQVMANHDANITCSYLTEVRATKNEL